MPDQTPSPAEMRIASAKLPTVFGDFSALVFEQLETGLHHLALVMGEVADGAPVLVRLHSECLTGDVLGSLRCDCGAQLEAAIGQIASRGRGILIYLRQEGRGIGLFNKVRAYALQDQGLDTVQANEQLGFPADPRDYLLAAKMLRHLRVCQLQLLTNNPRKIAALQEVGFQVVERVPLETAATPYNGYYLRTKREKLGHMLTGIGAERGGGEPRPGAATADAPRRRERPGFLELRLETGALAEQRHFYTRILELPLVEEAAGRFTVGAGSTRLTFTAAALGRPTYHFAFDIPENQLQQARDWLRARVPLLVGDAGEEVFHFPEWNAHGMYFHDPGGNVAELIARHDVPNAAPGSFGAGGVLYASEIGLVVDDVAAETAAIAGSLGLHVYRQGSAEFAPVGDERHLLILNHRRRGWWRDTPSLPYPLLARFGGDEAREYRPPGLPFTVLVEGPA
jgi:GTP cyclohydrolase II